MVAKLKPLSSSSSFNPSSSKNRGLIDEELNNKLENINKRLASVIAERKKLSPIKCQPSSKFDTQNETFGTDLPHGSNKRKKSPKKYKPRNMDIILTEISLSPYLTNPEKNYSKKTIQLPSIIHDLREKEMTCEGSKGGGGKGKKNAKSDCDSLSTSSVLNEKELNKFKKTFHEVVNYKYQYATNSHHNHGQRNLTGSSPGGSGTTTSGGNLCENEVQSSNPHPLPHASLQVDQETNQETLSG